MARKLCIECNIEQDLSGFRFTVDGQNCKIGCKM